jgi:peroxiredoxin
MKKTFRQVQFLSYIATIVIALLLGFIVVKQSFFSSSESADNIARQRPVNIAPQAPQRPVAPATPVGKAVPLQNVNWKENKKTLILYVSAACRYCTESAPFYQRLVKENSSKDVKIVAVLTQPVEEAKEYLKKHNVNIEEVHSASFSSIGVSATPTLLLVNEDGVISDYWRGRLQADKETEVLAKLSS